jgi:hypothetical protein
MKDALQFTDEFGDILRAGNAGRGHTGISTIGAQGNGPVFVVTPEQAVEFAQFLLKGTGYRVIKEHDTG